jgi:hypothetical protein
MIQESFGIRKGMANFTSWNEEMERKWETWSGKALKEKGMCVD